MITLIAVSYDLCSALTEGVQKALYWSYTLYKERGVPYIQLYGFLVNENVD